MRLYLLLFFILTNFTQAQAGDECDQSHLEQAAQLMSGLSNQLFDYLGDAESCGQGHVGDDVFTPADLQNYLARDQSLRFQYECPAIQTYSCFENFQVARAAEPTYQAAACSLNHLNTLGRNVSNKAATDLAAQAFNVCREIGADLRRLNRALGQLDDRNGIRYTCRGFDPTDPRQEDRVERDLETGGFCYELANGGRNRQMALNHRRGLRRDVQKAIDTTIAKVPYGTDAGIKQVIADECAKPSPNLARFSQQYRSKVKTARSDLQGLKNNLERIRETKPGGATYRVDEEFKEDYRHSLPYRMSVSANDKLNNSERYALMCHSRARKSGETYFTAGLISASVIAGIFTFGTGSVALSGVGAGIRSALIVADLGLLGVDAGYGLSRVYDSCYSDGAFTASAGASCTPGQSLGGEMQRTSRASCAADIAMTAVPTALLGGAAAYGAVRLAQRSARNSRTTSSGRTTGAANDNIGEAATSRPRAANDNVGNEIVVRPSAAQMRRVRRARAANDNPPSQMASDQGQTTVRAAEGGTTVGTRARGTASPDEQRVAQIIDEMSNLNQRGLNVRTAARLEELNEEAVGIMTRQLDDQGIAYRIIDSSHGSTAQRLQDKIEEVRTIAQSKKDSATTQLNVRRSRLESATDPKVRQRLERQIAYFQKLINEADEVLRVPADQSLQTYVSQIQRKMDQTAKSLDDLNVRYRTQKPGSPERKALGERIDTLDDQFTQLSQQRSAALTDDATKYTTVDDYALNAKRIQIVSDPNNPAIINRVLDNYDVDLIFSPMVRGARPNDLASVLITRGATNRLIMPIEKLMDGSLQQSETLLHEVRHLYFNKQKLHGVNLPYYVSVKAYGQNRLHNQAENFYNDFMNFEELSTWHRDLNYSKAQRFANRTTTRYNDGNVVQTSSPYVRSQGIARKLIILSDSADEALDSARATLRKDPNSISFSLTRHNIEKTVMEGNPPRPVTRNVEVEQTVATVPYVRDGEQIGVMNVTLVNTNSTNQARRLEALDEYLDQAGQAVSRHRDRAASQMKSRPQSARATDQGASRSSRQGSSSEQGGARSGARTNTGQTRSTSSSARPSQNLEESVEVFERRLIDYDAVTDTQRINMIEFINGPQARGSRIFDVENSLMKVLNELLGQDITTALTNQYKEILTARMQAFAQKHSDILRVMQYSDFKSQRFALVPTSARIRATGIPDSVLRELDEVFAAANTEFAAKIRSLDLDKEATQAALAAGKNPPGPPSTWFRAGLAKNADEANLNTRYAREQREGNNSMIHEDMPEVDFLRRQTFQNAERARRQSTRGLPANSPLIESIDGISVPTAEVFDLARKSNGNPEVLQRMINSAYPDANISIENAQKFIRYGNEVDQFQPGIWQSTRDSVSVARADNGALKIDVGGMGSQNARQTALQAARCSVPGQIVLCTRDGERIVTREFRNDMDAIRQISLNNCERYQLTCQIRISGDDVVIVPKNGTLPDGFANENLRAINDQLGPARVRQSQISNRVTDADARTELVNHGEDFEKLLRGRLRQSPAAARIKEISFSVIMRGSDVGQGGVRIEATGPGLRDLTDADRVILRRSYLEALNDLNKKTRGNYTADN